MACKVRKIQAEFPEADLIQILEILERGARVMEVAQRGIYQIDYRGLAKRLVFWLILERHKLTLRKKPIDKRAASGGCQDSPQPRTIILRSPGMGLFPKAPRSQSHHS